ncbi:TlpA family protein disulfide reductase [Pedobacter sp. ASV12]|uniref:TlpA family protein disulfide reductase n=1 Tax=Pedobacter sp. ASV12 TaxID=2795120 RepID=UPI0018EC9A64|nr:TlpA disulfide reductase family protein [Pedobacter sp. ASV12]
MRFLLNLLLCILLLGCRPSTPKIVLDIPEASALPLKAILWKLQLTDSGWQKVRFDSMAVTRKPFDWQLRHSQSFIANLTLYNAKGNIVGFTGDFIYSDAVLRVKPLSNEQPIQLKGYENATSMTVEGGENHLLDAKGFMAKPDFIPLDRAVDILEKATPISPKTRPLQERWEAYQRRTYTDVVAHRKAYYTLYRLTDLTHALPYPLIEKYYKALDPSLKNTPEGNYVLGLINSSKMIEAGILPGFEVLDKSRKPHRFTTLLTKKYYLLDFWASWCKPCRAQFPELRSLYQAIDTNKLQLISISIDKNDRHWQQALQEEKLAWHNYLQKDVSLQTKLLISYVPQNILLDENGKIISRNINLQDFKKFLASKGFLKKR